MLTQLLEFVVRYEYARALYDKRAVQLFADNQRAKELFDSLATTELNHSQKFQTLLPQKVVFGRDNFFKHPEYGKFAGTNIDGISKSKTWARFLFDGRSAKDYSLADSLAFCAAAERLETLGYTGFLILLWFLELIAKISNPDTAFLKECRRITRGIALEEKNAEVRLIEMLRELFPQQAKQLLFRWYFKAVVSMFVLVFTRNK